MKGHGEHGDLRRTLRDATPRFSVVFSLWFFKEFWRKKISVVSGALALVLALAGCASGASASKGDAGRRAPGNVPDFVKKALMNIPEDALVGIGTAKLASTSQSMTFAQTRARADISRQLNTMIQDMVRDYTASSEVEPSAQVAFQENFTLALSKSTLTGSQTVEMDTGPDGAMWAVVLLSKNNSAQEINQAVAAAKLAVPAMLSFDAEARMNEAFARAAGEELQVNDH
jgi:hypothetical protein